MSDNRLVIGGDTANEFTYHIDFEDFEAKVQEAAVFRTLQSSQPCRPRLDS